MSSKEHLPGSQLHGLAVLATFALSRQKKIDMSNLKEKGLTF